jgi:hypothetical protein
LSRLIAHDIAVIAPKSPLADANIKKYGLLKKESAEGSEKE